MPLTTTTRKLIIFTDLDGTLLDRHTYSFEQATPALHLIRRGSIPLILSSSKSRLEIELYREKLENEHPFISENGGAVFIPKNYFSFQIPYDKELDEYFVLELGTFYPQIIEILASIKRETGFPIKGFFDLNEKELASLSGLSPEEVALAKSREYDEPFIVEGGEREVEIIKRKIEEKGMNYAWGGKFHHLLGKNDKGKAVKILKELYENQFFLITTVGIGDSLNDLPMLLAADYPIFLRGDAPNLQDLPLKIQHLTILDGNGPLVWNEAILSLVKKLNI